MPLDEISAPTQAVTPWPGIDHSLIAETRPPPVPFPLRVLPDKWRAWVEAQAHSFTPVDYLAQGRRSPRCAAAASWRA